MVNGKNRFEWRHENMLATLGLIGGLTIGFISIQWYQRYPGDLSEHLHALGAAYALSVWQGEVWRFFSASFLNNLFFLYLINCLALFQFGRLLEPLYGPSRFILLFFLSGAFGFAANILTGNAFYFGSSLAVFGLIGGFFAAQVNSEITEERRRLSSFLATYVILHLWFFYSDGKISQVIGNSVVCVASLSLGAVVGFAFLAEKSRWSKAATPCLLIGLVAFFITIVAAIKPEFSSRYHLIMAVESLRMKDYPTSLQHSERLQSKRNAELLGQIVEARISANLGESERAFGLAQKAIGRSSDPLKFWKEATFANYIGFPSFGGVFFDEKGSALFCRVMAEQDIKDVEMLNDCAWLYLVALDRDLRNPKLALTLATEAIKISSEATSVLLNTLVEAYFQNGQLNEALQAVDRALIGSSAEEVKRLSSQKIRIERELAQVN